MATAKPEGAYDPTKRSWELGHEPFAAQLRTTYRDDMVEKRGKQAAMSKEAKADLRARISRGAWLGPLRNRARPRVRSARRHRAREHECDRQRYVGDQGEEG